MKPAALIWAALLLAACGGAQTAVQEFALDARDIEFGMQTIEVTAGQPVRLTLTNSGALAHDFSIADMPVVSVTQAPDAMAGHDMGHVTEPLAVHVAASPGGSATIEFTPTQPGAYEFFCTTAGHTEAGMIGTLIVQAP